MKAIVYRRNGPPDVLECEEVEKPVPGDGQVLVRVVAASINPLDWRLMRGFPALIRVLVGLGGPRIAHPGVDLAGVVEAAGRKVTRLAVGDSVFGLGKGAFAEFVCAAESTLVPKPENVSFEQAASVGVAAVTALQGLRDQGKLQRGQEVLINGASGGVGLFAVQIARTLGARTTGVCSASNLDLVRSLGAEQVVDYTSADFTRSGRRYDLILDNVGNHSAWACRRALAVNGRCVMVGAPKGHGALLWFLVTSVLAGALLSRLGSRRFAPFIARPRLEDLEALAELMKDGQVVPVVDRTYPAREVRAAMTYAEQGHARGKVVLTL